MKVLFAIGDAVTSENIVKHYYALYGEKIEYKNVFYFKALLEEVKRDKTYDRIVIAEQLEPPQRNIVDAIDQMIFNNIDSITDELEDSTIIFICSDGRTKNDALIGRLFNIGIYNLLMGDERDIIPLCGLIKDPRNKKEAKEYLKSNPAIRGNVTISNPEDEVEEVELLNISKYFNNLKTTNEYLEKFAIVEEQYNQRQLQTIVLALYQNLKKGKEIYETLSSDPRYSKYCVLPISNTHQNSKKGKEVHENSKADFHNTNQYVIEDSNSDPIDMSKSSPSIVGGILGFLSGKKIKAKDNAKLNRTVARERDEINRVESQSNVQDEISKMADRASEEAKNMMDKAEQEARAQAEQLRIEAEERRKAEREEKLKAQQEAQLKAQQEAQLKAQQEAQLKAQQEAQLKAQQEAQLKAQQEAQLRAQQEAQLKAQQEAQLKAQQEAQLKAQQEAQLKAQQEAQLKAQQEAQLRAQQEAQLKAQQEAQLKAQQEAQLRAEQEAQLKAEQEAKLRAEQEAQLKAEQEAKLRAEQEAQVRAQNSYFISNLENNSVETQNLNYKDNNLQEDTTSFVPNTTQQFFVPADYKKVVAFVGTNKVGTSFVVNSIANLMAKKNVKTTILDMTKNRGMYWYYNDTMYKKENIIASCMSNLSNGISTPVQVGKYKNLSLYTTIPGGREDNRKSYKHRTVIETAKKSCNLLIIDCDFTTPYEYLEQASEIYVVQDLDLVKVKETKEFFRELKTRGMDWSKLRIVMNNCVKCKVTPKKIIKNALTYYNDPSMTFTEEFEEIKKFVEIPLDPLNYSNYIESMEDGKLNFDKFTPEFKTIMEQLSVMVYGMVSSSAKRKGLFG